MAHLLALAFCVAGPELPRIPVVLSTDFGVGIDDQWALSHLALSPRIELRGVVTSHGPGLRPEAAAGEAKAWLERLPIARRPEVVAGSAVALADRRTPRPNPGVDMILKESRRGAEERRVVVVVIGPATDAASALLLDPTLAERVEIVAMGFSRWPAGGDPWNVKNDVGAWQTLLDSGVPVVVGDDNVCRRRLAMSSPRAHRLFDRSGEAGRALTGLLDARLRAYRGHAEKTPGDNPKGWPVWDEVTVAHLLGLTEVRRVPRPRLRDDLSFDLSDPSPRGTIGWITSVDSDALWADLAACLGKAP